MIRPLITAVAFLLLGCASVPATLDLGPMRAVTTRVDVEGGHGSGVLLDATHVLTAAHVVEGTKAATVVLSDGQVVPAKVEWRGDPDGTDAALLTLGETVDGPMAATTCRKPVVGETVYLAGWPGKLESISVIPGMVQGRYKGFTGRTWLVTARVVGGMSGGPVFDAAGEVLGWSVAEVREEMGMFGGSSSMDLGLVGIMNDVCTASVIGGVRE